jgi:hypothetical protein
VPPPPPMGGNWPPPQGPHGKGLQLTPRVPPGPAWSGEPTGLPTNPWQPGPRHALAVGPAGSRGLPSGRGQGHLAWAGWQTGAMRPPGLARPWPPLLAPRSRGSAGVGGLPCSSMSVVDRELWRRSLEPSLLKIPSPHILTSNSSNTLLLFFLPYGFLFECKEFTL